MLNRCWGSGWGVSRQISLYGLRYASLPSYLDTMASGRGEVFLGFRQGWGVLFLPVFIDLRKLKILELLISTQVSWFLDKILTKANPAEISLWFSRMLKSLLLEGYLKTHTPSTWITVLPTKQVDIFSILHFVTKLLWSKDWKEKKNLRPLKYLWEDLISNSWPTEISYVVYFLDKMQNNPGSKDQILEQHVINKTMSTAS